MSSVISLTSITTTVIDSDCSRLIDLEPEPSRSKLQVIVVGRPGADTEAVGDALKVLGYKVYDLQAAGLHHERDFGLWHEAARMRQNGVPYSREDYDKLLGRYNAVVCAPTGFIDHQFVELYRVANTKVIMLSDESGADAVKALLDKVHWFARFKYLTDKANKEFFAYLREYAQTSLNTKIDKQAVRNAVDSANLLEIDSLTNWDQLCTFLHEEAPITDPLPKRSKSTVGMDLFTQPVRTLNELTMIYGEKLTKLFTSLCIGAGITITGKIVARESTSAAAAIVFGMCIMATIYWHRCSVSSSQSTTTTLASITSDSPKIENTEPKGMSSVESKIESKTQSITKLPASAFVPPHLRKSCTSSLESTKSADLPELATPIAKAEPNTSRSETSIHRSDDATTRPAIASGGPTPPHLRKHRSPVSKPEVQSRASTVQETTMPRPHTPPTQQRTLPRSALTPPHLRDIIVPAVKSVAESTNSAGPDQSVPRPQTPPARRTLSPSAFTPPHLRKSIVPSLNSPSESKASSKQEATVSRPQTPPNQRTLAYTPPHLRKSLSPTDSTKLEATSRPADAITRPVGDTSPQPANTMRNPTHPRPHFNDDRRGSSANNARINTRNNTRNGRSRVIGQAGPAQNDDNNVARSIEPPKPRPAVAGAWGNFAANIANSDKATQAEINEKTKTLVGQSKLSETFKAIQNGNYV